MVGLAAKANEDRALFGIGLMGFTSRRNMIIMFLAAEMMLQGISVSLVAWGRYHGDWGGQMLVVFIITVAACEAGIALALVLMLFQKSGKLDAAVWQELREEGTAVHTDPRLPDDREDRVWPVLTPAGIEPELDHEALEHRRSV